MKSPCYKCTSEKGYRPDVKRSISCHDNCKYYQQWRNNLDQANKKRRKYSKNRYDNFVSHQRNECRVVMYSKKED